MKQILMALAIVLSVSLGASTANAVQIQIPNDDGLFNVSAFQLSSGQLNNTNETVQIWNAIDNGAGIGDTPVPPGGHTIGALEFDMDNRVIYNGNFDGFTGSQGYGTINSDGPGGSGGSITGGTDFSVRAQTLLEFTVGGTYSISAGSDDGRLITLSDIGRSTGYTGFIAAGNQVDGFTAGDETIIRNAPTGHAHTTGVFTVAAGDVLSLESLFYERGGGDQFHLSIKDAADTGHGGTGDGWALLTDGEFGIQLSSALIPVPEPTTAVLGLLGMAGLARRRRSIA